MLSIARFDPVDGGLHAGHQVRRMQVRERGSQETFGGFGLGDATHHQQAGERRGDFWIFQAKGWLRDQFRRQSSTAAESAVFRSQRMRGRVLEIDYSDVRCRARSA